MGPPHCKHFKSKDGNEEGSYSSLSRQHLTPCPPRTPLHGMRILFFYVLVLRPPLAQKEVEGGGLLLGSY